MSADSFHRIVERLKQKNNVYDFNAFVNIINFKGDAKELSHSILLNTRRESHQGSMHHLNLSQKM